MKKLIKYLVIIFLLLNIISQTKAALVLKEIRTASSDVLVVVFNSEIILSSTNYNTWINTKIDVNEVKTDDISAWKLNGEQPLEIYKFVTESSATNSSPKRAEHRIFLKVPKLIDGAEYKLETPHGDTTFVFNDRTMFCELIKTNQNAYSGLSHARFANFAIWLGTGGSKQIEGELPEYEVYEMSSGNIISQGTLNEIGHDESSGDFVYRINLSDVPEGGPYKILVKGYGCSWPFGVGGDFSSRLGYVSFRSMYYQRCGIPLKQPYAWEDIRMNPCHTILYDVNAPNGEANLNVVGTEPSFTVYGGYHDAGDADRRLYHLIRVPPVLMTTYEAFPEYFYDNQFNIPDKFDKDFNILGKGNGIPDIIDEAEWATLIWEYLQDPDGSVHWGTETRGYPEPFEAPMDRDTKKYGTLHIDNEATGMAAGVFMHLARLLKPYKPERSEELRLRAEKAMAYVGNNANDQQKLYFAVQKYLLTGDNTAHQQVKDLINRFAASEANNPGSSNYSNNILAVFFYPYLIEKEKPTDQEVIQQMKDILRNTADREIEIFNSFAYPVGNPITTRRQWGNNVNQGQHAYPCLLEWGLTKEQKYIDVVSQLMDYNQGLNPIGKCYVTGIGFDQVKNPHDRESEYTKSKGWGVKPGILIYGPGNLPDNIQFTVLPEITALPRERQWVDHLFTYGMNEFTIHETLIYPAVVYPVLAEGRAWDDTKDPFDVADSSPVSGIKVNEQDKIEIYPNPVKNNITISSTANDEIYNLKLLDSLGKVVAQIDHINLTKINLNMNAYPKGIYLLRIESQSGTSIKKLIKID